MRLLLLGAMLLLAGCGPDETGSPSVLYEGFRLIAGDGGAPVEPAALLVEGGLIEAVGRRAEIERPRGATRVDLTGKTVLPALVSLHGHVGFQRGLSYAEENYTRENLVDHLERYAYHGVGTILSLGTDPGDLAFEIRAEQRNGSLDGARLLTAGRGLARPNAGPGNAAMRSSALGVTTGREALEAVRGLAGRAVDVVKIWVDDRGGTVPKLTPDLYRPVIEEAHRQGLQVVAHVYYADDAADLVEAGVDGFAHLPRDREVTSEEAAAIARHDVFVMPNLGISERGTHADPPEWLDDPLLRETVTPDVIARARESFSRRTPQGVARARASYAAMQQSVRTLKEAGVRLVLGADSGVQDHFYGYTELRELELMVAAGLTPAEAIEAATGVSAAALGIDEAGVLEMGRSADFIVLDADPLEDIANVRRIDRVVLKGVEVDRAGLRRRWVGRQR